MPKEKKPKAISLVCAYESGAETQTESENESEISESTQSSRSASQSESRSPSSQGREDENLDTGKKRSRDDVEERDENEFQEGISMDYEDSIEDLRKKSKIETIIESDQNQIESKDREKSEENIESDVLINNQDENFFTEENGFLPGCEKIKIPPAPEAQCSQSLQNKIIQVLNRMEHYNYSINNDIKNKKKFKNPSIYEKLIDAYGIDEFGSSFDTHIEDLKANGYMFYDELDQAQMAEWAKKDKERKERTKIEMVTGTKKK
ncbi:unnamed protein product [Brachionus calyciflorus]|uniref:SAP30-binding protein n=1 Tax=Brachionus calyciflorus TaxID=104777 RepID=A0A813Q522_9BILA|nr:unnamed protein product [Brachionus calyciflorus]